MIYLGDALVFLGIYAVFRSRIVGDAARGGALKRIILLATVVAVMAAMIAASALSVTAQEDGQYASMTEQAAPICAPWSKAWDISNGWWYFQWYRWCYDPSTSDPYYEGSWYQELGSWEWDEQVNLCPESGSCTMSPGRMQMSTDTPLRLLRFLGRYIGGSLFSGEKNFVALPYIGQCLPQGHKMNVPSGQYGV